MNNQSSQRSEDEENLFHNQSIVNSSVVVKADRYSDISQEEHLKSRILEELNISDVKGDKEEVKN